MRGIFICHIKNHKKLVLAPFSSVLGAIPTVHPSAKFRPNPSSFLNDIRENVFYDHYNTGVKTCKASGRQ